eukprot:gene9830-10838_t
MHQNNKYPRWHQNNASNSSDNFSGRRNANTRWRYPLPRPSFQQQQWRSTTGFNTSRTDQGFDNYMQTNRVQATNDGRQNTDDLQGSLKSTLRNSDNQYANFNPNPNTNISFDNHLNVHPHGPIGVDMRQHHFHPGHAPRHLPPFANYPPPFIQNFSLETPPPYLPHVPFAPYLQNPDVNVDKDTNVNEDDKKLIQEWLRERNIKKTEAKSIQMEPSVKITDAKRMLTEYLCGVNELVENRDRLSQSLQASEPDWSEVAEKCEKLMDHLKNVQLVLFNPSCMEKLQGEVKKRQKKRERQRKKRELNAKEKQKKLEKAVLWDQKIDEWRQRILSDIHSKKLTDSLKSEAGKSLMEVRKKKSESSKYLDKLTSIHELRGIRRETALQRGVFIFGEEDRKFEKRIKSLIDLLENRIDEYKDEEKTLVVMLEEEKEQIQKEDEKKRKNQMQNEHVRVFGYDPLLECRRYWQQAEESSLSLVQIRRLWDVYIVPDDIPGADHIPDGWVQPEPGKNQAWDQYLKKHDGSIG